MTRLIDADALINNLEMLILEQEEDDHVETWNNAIACAINEVKHHAPTVDAVKHGIWIEENTRPRSSQFYCSVCHRTAYDPQPTRIDGWVKRCRYAYCPNCGAIMDEREES